MRWIIVNRFKREIKQRIKNNYDRIDFVGHSFGTHIIAWALRGIKSDEKLNLNTIILAGSVLKSTFNWDPITRTRSCRIINDCGSSDNVLLLSQFWVLFTGMAGRVGFITMSDHNFKNRFSNFGHSGYFINKNKEVDASYMRENWIPLIVGSDTIRTFDARTTISALDGLLITLGNNAEPVKMAIYAAPFVALALWMSNQRDSALAAALMSEFRTQELLNDATSAELLPLAAAAARLSNNPAALALAERESRRVARRLAKIELEEAPHFVAPHKNKYSLSVANFQGVKSLKWHSNSTNYETLYENKAITAVDKSSDSKYFMRYRDNHIEIINSDDFSISKNFRLEGSKDFLSLSSDAQLVANGDTQRVWVYDTNSGNEIAGSPFEIAEKCNLGSISRAKISADGHYIFATSALLENRSLCKIDIRNGSSANVSRRSDFFNEMTVSEGEKQLATSSTYSILLYDRDGTISQIQHASIKWNGKIQFSSNGKFIAASHLNSVRIWDTVSHRILADIETDILVSDFAFADEDRLLVVGGKAWKAGKAGIEVWDLEAAATYKDARRAPPPDSTLFGVLEDGSTLLHQKDSGLILIRDKDGNQRSTTNLGGSAQSVAHDKAHNRIIGYGPQGVQIWDLAHLKRFAEPHPPEGGKLYATVGGDHLPVYVKVGPRTGTLDILSIYGAHIATDVKLEANTTFSEFIDEGRYTISKIVSNPGTSDEIVKINVTNNINRMFIDFKIDSEILNYNTSKFNKLYISTGSRLLVINLFSMKIETDFPILIYDSFSVSGDGNRIHTCIDDNLSVIDIRSKTIVSLHDVDRLCVIKQSIISDKDDIYIHTTFIQKFNELSSNNIENACTKLRQRNTYKNIVKVASIETKTCPTSVIDTIYSFLIKFYARDAS